VPGYYYGVIYTASNTPLTYIWDFGDGTTSNQLFPSHTYATPGYYTICLTVSDGAGCSFTFCDSSFYAFKYGGGPMVHFDVRNSWGLGITNVSSANGISLYPNPTTGEISINTSGQKIDNATISDINGQTVLNTKSPTQNKMDVSQLSDGIYFIEVKVNGISTRLKFVKAN
jgi:PKD repeat protein